MTSLSKDSRTSAQAQVPRKNFRGTALRDATGIVSFNQFSNQLDYADVSKELNGRALKAAFANVDPASLAGKTVTFFGAFTFDPHLKTPVLITPVRITF